MNRRRLIENFVREHADHTEYFLVGPSGASNNYVIRCPKDEDTLYVPLPSWLKIPDADIYVDQIVQRVLEKYGKRAENLGWV